MAGGLMKFSDLIQKLLARRSTGKPEKLAPDAGVHLPAQTPLIAAPADTLHQARQAAFDADRDVDEVSRAHLAILMASPARYRIAHLSDPELTPADRAELANSVRSALPVSLPLTFARWRPSGLLRRLRLVFGYKSFVALVVLVACAVLSTLAWRNTGTRIVGSDTNWSVDWSLPDGSLLHGIWKATYPAIAMQPRSGKVILRYWMNGRGYATTEVDERWLLNHSFTYIVAPIGATDAASPVNR
jgi:hypothetical protein